MRTTIGTPVVVRGHGGPPCRGIVTDVIGGGENEAGQEYAVRGYVVELSSGWTAYAEPWMVHAELSQ